MCLDPSLGSVNSWRLRAIAGRRDRRRRGRLRVSAVACVALALCVSAFRVAHAGINVWTNSGPDGLIIRVLAVDPVTPTTVYAGTGDVSSPRYGSIFKSTDGGAHWTSSSSGLPAVPVYAWASRPSRPCAPQHALAQLVRVPTQRGSYRHSVMSLVDTTRAAFVRLPRRRIPNARTQTSLE